MSARCGEILLVNYPFTDTSGSKLRPALVVSVNQFNQGDDIVILPISSVSPVADAYAFEIRDTDSIFCQTGLRTTSYVKWTKPVTISETVAVRRLGQLPSKLLAEVQAKLRTVFEM